MRSPRRAHPSSQPASAKNVSARQQPLQTAPEVEQTINTMATKPTAAASLDDDEEVWLNVMDAKVPSVSSLPKGLLDMERELRCPICKDFFHNPVSILPCHHTFCSECIRTYFTGQIKSLVRKARCAACKCGVDTKNDKCYIPNRSVQRLVGIFAQRVRDPLLRVLRDGGELAAEVEMDTSDSKQPGRTRGENRSMLEAEDTTLEDSSQPAEVKKLRSKRSKPHYAGKSKAQLKKLCRDEGLSTTGTESELRQRHTDFIVLYNSECDSYTPRPIQALVDIIHQREHARAKQNRTHHQHDISKLHVSDPTLKSGFQKMIQDLKEKKRKEREAAASSSGETKTDSSAAPATACTATSQQVGQVQIASSTNLDTGTTSQPTTAVVDTTATTMTTTRTEPSPAPKEQDLRSRSPFPPAPALPPPTVLTTTSALMSTTDTSPPNKRKSPLGQSQLNFDKRPRKTTASSSSKKHSPANNNLGMIPAPSWTCDRCTYQNPAQLQPASRRFVPRCEICEAPRKSGSRLSTASQVLEVE